MKHLVKKWALGLSLCVLALGLGASAKADFVTTLDTLLQPNASVSIGDKIFADFDFTAVEFDAAGAPVIPAVNPALIAVTFKDPTPAGVYNVLFQSNQFNAQNGGIGFLDMKLDFTVETASGLPLITGVDLERGFVAGGGTLDIIESVDFNGPPPGSTGLHVWQDANGGGPVTDFKAITPSSKVWVSKDILLQGDPNGSGISQFTDFTQSFHQQAIPEPASCVLMGVGLIVGAVAWRRRKAA